MNTGKIIKVVLGTAILTAFLTGCGKNAANEASSAVTNFNLTDSEGLAGQEDTIEDTSFDAIPSSEDASDISLLEDSSENPSRNRNVNDTPQNPDIYQSVEGLKREDFIPILEMMSLNNERIKQYRDILDSDSFVEEFAFDDPERIQCALIYLDSDDVPELVAIEGDWHYALCKIYSTEEDGTPYEMMLFPGSMGAFRYREKEGVIRLEFGNHGYFRQYYIKAEGHKITYLGASLVNGTGFPLSEDGESAPISYQIDLQHSKEVVARIEANSRFFYNESQLITDWDNTPVGEEVDEETYEEYGKAFLGEKYSLVGYHYY